MTRGIEVLLTSLNREAPETKNNRLQQYSADQWQEALAAAKLHGVEAVLFHVVKDIRDDLDVPGNAWEEMRKRYYLSAARNMRLYRELQKILDRFDREKIPVIVLKGAHLAEKVYGNIALRGMGDVDMLVKKDDLKMVEEILLEFGGEPLQCNHVVTEGSCHFAYKLFESKLRVEIHWKLIPPVYSCQINLEDIWNRAQPLQPGKTKALAFSPEDLLVYICAHSAKHAADFKIRMLYDIAKILECYQSKLDWAAIGARARQWGVLRAVYVLLRMAREMLGAAVTGEQLKELRPEQFEEEKYNFARKQMLGTGVNNDEVIISQPAARLWGLKGVKGKIALILNRIFLPREAMSLMYPAPADSWRIYLYYPVRIKDILVRHGKGIWQLICGNAKTYNEAEKVREVMRLREWLISG